MEDKKESYLSKLKSLFSRHIGDIIKKDVEEYKGNIEMKHGVSVKSKQEIIKTVNDMITFNKSGKVSEKIKATKEEIINIVKDVKEQTLAALKGGKTKYDDDMMDDMGELFDEVEDNIEEDGVAVENITSLNPTQIDTVGSAVDSNTQYPEEETINLSYHNIARSAAAITFDMALKSKLNLDYVEFIENNPDYLNSMLHSIDDLNNLEDDPESRDNMLIKEVLDPTEPQDISLEDEEELGLESIYNVEVEETQVSELPRHVYSEDYISQLRDLASRSDDNVITKAADAIQANRQLFESYCNYVGTVAKTLIKDVSNLSIRRHEEINETENELVIYTFDFICDTILREYASYDLQKAFALFCSSVLNILDDEVYDEMLRLSSEINDKIKQEGGL